MQRLEKESHSSQDTFWRGFTPEGVLKGGLGRQEERWVYWAQAVIAISNGQFSHLLCAVLFRFGWEMQMLCVFDFL